MNYLVDNDIVHTLIGLLVTSGFFLYINKTCFGIPPKRSPFLYYLGTIAISPFSYMFVCNTVLTAIDHMLSPALGNLSLPQRVIFGLLIRFAVFAIPMVFALRLYHNLVKQPKPLCFFIYSMLWIMHFDAQLVSNNFTLYFITLFLFTVVWFSLFRRSISILVKSNITEQNYLPLNASLITALIMNMILDGALLIPQNSLGSTFLPYWVIRLWLTTLGLSMYLMMLFFFRNLFEREEKRQLLEKKNQENEDLARLATETQDQVIFAFAQMVESKSGQTGQHVKRVSEFTRIIAEKMGMDRKAVETIRVASMMHDIGKLMIPSTILDKPGKLTTEEYEEMRKHVIFGGQLLENSKGTVMECAKTIAEEHHERWDGNGYTKGLKGTAIALPARIVSVADVFDAVTAKRSYHDQRPLEEGRDVIIKGSGSQFDPAVVDAFIAAYGQIQEVHANTPD